MNHYLSFKTIYLRPLFITLGIVFFTNIFLLIYLLIRNTYRIEKAIKPALNGIQALSKSETFHLDEKGELSEINICLNHAGEYLQKKITHVQNGFGVFHMISVHHFLSF